MEVVIVGGVGWGCGAAQGRAAGRVREVLVGNQLGAIASCSLEKDRVGEDPPEVGDRHEEDEQDRKDQPELDQGLAG